MSRNFLFGLVMCSLPVVFVACGGSGGDPTPVAATPTKISGAAVKGPVAGAAVTVKKVSDGSVVGTTTTKSDGTYSLDVTYSGDVVIEISGGTYTDEATNVSTTLTTPLKSVLTVSGTEVVGVVTPLTTMAFSSAFPAGASVTAAAFKTAANQLATQFQLSSVDITSTIPVVTGKTNAYGKALIGVSKYLQQNNVTLATVTEKTLTSAEWSSFSGKYSAAYNLANGTQVSYNINGGTITSSVTGTNGNTVTTTADQNGATVSGTGAGGGSGTCGVNVAGSIVSSGFTVPINFNYCVKGLVGSCDAGNSSLSQSVAGQQGLAGAANLKYTYSSSCATGAYNITIQ